MLLIKQSLLFFLLLISSSFTAQNALVDPPVEDDTAVQISRTITGSDMKSHLSILASDEYEGRETGTPGNEKAAAYIAKQLKEMGIPPLQSTGDYFQPVNFSWQQWKDIGLTINGKSYRHLWDFISFPHLNQDRPTFSADEIVFLGYGIDDTRYSDYKGVDVKDKVIMIYKGEPVNKNGKSQITDSKELSPWSSDIGLKIKVAQEKGVKQVLVIENEIQKMQSENRRYLVGPYVSLEDGQKSYYGETNTIYISTNIAKAIMGDRFKKVIKARKKMQKKGKAKSINLDVAINVKQKKGVRSLAGHNVLGFVEGSDEKLKEEILVVTAHYDHIGRRGDDIFNGADDNGSGTSTVLELAEAFQKAKMEGNGARRSVLFMLVTGEEKGLLGSKYYTERPVFSLDNTIANINIDMVGRVDEKHKTDPNYIYVIGSNRLSTELHDINEAMNKEHTQLELDYTYNAEDDPNRYYYRSDHYNFAEKGIPAVFFFNGTHADYHRSTDTIEKINFEKMEKIGRLVFHTAWELANRDERIKVDVPQK